MSKPDADTRAARWNHHKLTQEELICEATERFGPDHWTWAATCPNCGDTATLADFRQAGADPGKWGQECIGRHLGALDKEHPDPRRGCDFAAYGLIPGPWELVVPAEGDKPQKTIRCFPLAEAKR